MGSGGPGGTSENNVAIVAIVSVHTIKEYHRVLKCQVEVFCLGIYRSAHQCQSEKA